VTRPCLLLAALLLAAPAQARKHKSRKPPAPRPARAEDDPRRKGNDKAFAKATAAFREPEDLAQLEAGLPVRIRLEVQRYALGPAPAAARPARVPHLHLIVDNEPAMEVSDLSLPLTLTGLGRGPHLLRAVLCRPWHEVVKAPHAFAMVRFWIGARLEGKSGKAAEYVAWPDPKKPILTYVLPVGEPGKGAPRLKLVREIQQQQPDAAAPEVQAPLPTSPGPERAVLDFYLANGKLARRGDKMRVVLDRRELPLVTEWKPQHLRRARWGAHKITVDLLNRKGLKVKNAVNRTDRVFTAGG
jgi:hypothetical protein